MPQSLPDISTLKLSQLRDELNLYGINSSTFCEKSEMITALQHARETLPRPTTSYREVEPTPPPPQPSKDEDEKKKFRAMRRNSITKPSPFPSSSSGGGGAAAAAQQNSHHSTPTPPTTTTTTTTSSQAASSSSAAAKVAPTTPPTTTSQNINAKKALALRSPVVILQRVKEKPTATPSTAFAPHNNHNNTTGERTNSFLPGSPFSFAIHGSIYDEDAAILRIPDGTCLTINSASVDAKSMELYLHQKGALGVSLQLSSEENPTLLPIWTFEKEKSSSYNISNLGIRVAGPRNIRLKACMEMGYRSGASVDVYVFGSVTLDGDKF